MIEIAEEVNHWSFEGAPILPRALGWQDEMIIVIGAAGRRAARDRWSRAYGSSFVVVLPQRNIIIFLLPPRAVVRERLRGAG